MAVEHIELLSEGFRGFVRDHVPTVLASCEIYDSSTNIICTLLGLSNQLLWVVGIAHGDVSFHNIMTKPDSMVGVLNDSELATIIAPKRGIIIKKFCRTGTPLFMTGDLLSKEASITISSHSSGFFYMQASVS